MDAKAIVLKPITAQEANALVRRVHYSGKVVNNSQFHIGVYLGNKLEGAMQFGPSLDKRKLQGLVADTPWNGFIELNRMAFTNNLPRNSESRALSVAMRLLRKHAPHLQWVVTFADGTQCGDGTIYRAAGFHLTSIKVNNQIWRDDSGPAVSRAAITALGHKGASAQRRQIISRVTVTNGQHITDDGGASMRQYAGAGFKPLPGFQLRYVYFLDPTARERLTVPILPYTEITRRGAGMYRGQPRAGSIGGDALPFHGGEGGSNPDPGAPRGGRLMAGRKSLYTEERVKEIETSLSLGLTDKDAALCAGITDDTLINWKKKYSDFSDRVTRAKAKRTQTWLLLLRQHAMAGDTRAITELLDRCAPDYRKTTDINLSGNLTSVVQIIGVDEDDI